LLMLDTEVNNILDIEVNIDIKNRRKGDYKVESCRLRAMYVA
jgi:hypothetical protein